ncbi:MAG: undecaprenyl-diphosphate phosphatase [Candidatus Peregrinibacteria bacterium]
MTITHALFLGFLQGITELLPISSSGHLALAEHFFAFSFDPLTLQGFDVTLHAGTLLALLLCYDARWRVIILSVFTAERSGRVLLFSIVIATIPAAVSGFFLERIIAETLRGPFILGLSFIATAVILLLTESIGSRSPARPLTPVRAFVIGCAQALALVPALSRSGLTAGTGRMMGLSRIEAVDFSFLMAVPAIVGALLLTINGAFRGEIALPGLPILVSGFLSAFVVSMVAVVFLRRFVRTRSLAWFSCYLIPVGIAAMLWR